MITALALSPAMIERLGHPAAPRPERPAERVGSRSEARAIPTASELARPSLEPVSEFLVHELLAAAPELGIGSPSRRQAVAAYQAQLARRIHYSGPVIPVDLRV
jgi:hypothetical protein